MSRRLLVAAAVLVVLGVAAWGGLWWWNHRYLVSTDNAYVRASVALITPRVAGTVTELAVEENRPVSQGDLLARLDPTDYEMKVHEAEAALDEARQQLETERSQVRAADSAVVLAQAELDLAGRDYARVEQLARQKVASPDELDRSSTALRVDRARLESAKQDAERARAALGIALDAPDTAAPIVRRAAANRDEAALLLSYTQIRAPFDGVLATRDVQLGQHVDMGQVMMRIVPLRRAYVEANFKETQLEGVRIGQPATIDADIYPGFDYHGVVDSLAPGTGAAFSLLPPENATGNWIKVVQRVPVKIRLTEPPPADHPLRVGLSVVATIDTRDQSGQSLVAAAQR